MDAARLPRFCIILWAVFLLGGFALLGPSPVSAHPADEYLQHLQIDLSPNRVDLTIAIGGGVLSKQALIGKLDSDGDGAASAAEIAAWRQTFVQELSVTLDGRPLVLDPDKVTVTVPDLQDFAIGLQPIEIAMQLPAAAPVDVQQLLIVTNRYQELKSTYTYDVSTSGGVGIVTQGWPSKEIRLVYGTGVGTPATHSETTRYALGSTALATKAANLFARDHTPGFFLVLLSTFAIVGALHAAQPGHGKALVAGYLVATQGTMRDAFALASIVTITHTVGVFALGGITIAASAIFLPSKVVPIMQILSAGLVILLGLNLVHRAIRRPASGHSYEHHHHDHAHEHHHPHHGHAHLTEEAHARLHLDEALAMRNRASVRDLLTLGIAGGIVPCPEALAILLLAIGLHQAWLGMLAIVSFSLGLAGVLVAFGAVVAVLQSRSFTVLQHLPGGHAGTLGTVTSRATRLLPLASGIVITSVGVIMLFAQIRR
jgi:ABC-type nickel/cobalt efflux system permease component RcnA